MDILLTTTYACGLLIVSGDGIIKETAPIYKWMKDKPLFMVLFTLRNKKQLVGAINLEKIKIQNE